ncbi:NAD-dependent malic enzyme [Candidatus Gracilibacteria bacterium CG17_big_fil_post_rev_8_21_14_2_50_48_13]|nr:MAG: NAD-dependent malic enzyme [Candidatus Gracilibacteria bacterium CG17_big_fil_post_rev_8_21_14_2_50_48_13]
MNVGEQSLALHKKYGGKIGIAPKMEVNTKADLGLVYTPGVGHVCSEIAEHPELVHALTLKKNTIAVISDGSAVLGLGNIGPHAAIPVMEGKALLFKKMAGLDAFPICIDTQDTEELIRTIENIAPVFGGINLEDISAPRCFEIERRLRERLSIPVVHDDQHGTAVVVLAGLINALQLRGADIVDAHIVINGAGAAGTSVAELLHAAGAKHLLMLDSQGILHAGREDLNEEKKALLRFTNREGKQGNLRDALRGADVFIGVSKGNLLTREDIATMQKNPLVFALANPIPEILPEEAKAGGAFITATGRSDFPNQMNNALVFPGLFLGALTHGIRLVTEEHFLVVAKALASYVTTPDRDHILPDVLDGGVAAHVAAAMGTTLN